MQFMYAANGGGGYDCISTTWLPLLKKRGLSDEQLHLMMVDNPRRALTGER
jgi:predicted metal-dependent phosphotriesterase family hydrolase